MSAPVPFRRALGVDRDASGRRSHLAGAVGAALGRCGFAQGWFRPMEGTRALAVTPAGYAMLGNAFDLHPVPPT